MEERKTITTLVVVQLLFGLLPVSTKLVFEYLGPMSVAAIRSVGAALVLAYLHPFLVRNPVPWREAPRVMVFALFGILLNQGLFITGLQRTTAINATLLITTIPVFTYAIAVLTRRETLGPRRAAGIALAMFGILYLLGLSRFEAGWDNALGDLMVTLNALSFAIFLVFSKPLAERYDALSLTTGLFLVGGLVFLPIGLATGLAGDVDAMPALGWAVMLFIILGPTVGAYALNNTALRRVPASTVAVFIYIQPLIAAATAAWLLGETLTWRLAPAAVLVFAGVWLVARRRPKILRGAPVTA